MKANRVLISSIAWAMGSAFPFAIFAASPATGTLPVQITITADCSVAAGANTLDFGSNASTTSGPVSADTGFDVTCTEASAYTIGLKSVATSATDGTGEMAATPTTGKTITYQLYSDAAGSSVWGDEASSNRVSSTGTGVVQNFTVYGKTTSTLNVPVGIYKDTVNISVYF